MVTTPQGTIRLFRFSGIDVYLHWSWFLVAAYEISERKGTYSSIGWNAVEYLTLFGIVTLHEFGHALACRQVGGRADQIVLWPLGGVAYVNPPPRPGATLWSIAAGPLVNAVLVPILTGLGLAAKSAGMAAANPDAYALLRTVWGMNLVLLIFNMLPIYPLDGGQILRSLLWFPLGRARSLTAAAVLGLVGVAGLIGLAVWAGSMWFAILSVFIVLNCWRGLQQARALARLEELPRREGFACPACKAKPPMGNLWLCAQCRKPFDTFQTKAVCPNCGAQYPETACFSCGRRAPMSQWEAAAYAMPKV